MFTKLLIALFFVATTISTANAANIPAASSVVGFGRSDVAGSGINLPIPGITHSDIIALNGVLATNEANTNFRKFVVAKSSTDQAQYQVDGAGGTRTFYVTSVKYANKDASATCEFNLGYGTAALASDGTATPPTGAVTYGTAGTAVSGAMFSFSTSASLGTAAQIEPVYGVSFPPQSFPYIRSVACNDAAGITIYGYLK